MKILMKLILAAGLAAGVSNCLLLDTLSVTPDRVKGDEARKMISDGVLNGWVVYSATLPASLRGVAAAAAILDQVITNAIAKIDDSKYYKKSDVEACVQNILVLSFVTSGYIAVAVTCDMPEDPMIL